ncbi:uncharacterized protein LOC113505298 [Trichoplusia ni]|uniref:Uncharacterized protein LOC113498760 n=1 Tax=Trichoplusia ni TaxID=7111 RepID=A0A7E5WTX1_TRINI|nr:uncharacterized protein LOC113498760 [Trichoplusia ni]XP_026743722.1 uncharacterized protein LOC113505298 [Trichoplusia ni]
MKRGLLVLLAMCSLACAMVPRERRAVPTETDAAPVKATDGEKYCASHTPCAWTVYQKVIKVPEMTIVNTYCVCEENLECQEDEDDGAIGAYVHRCKARGSKTEKSAS